VYYPADRVTHFHVIRDNAQHLWTFSQLLGRKLIPWPHKNSTESTGICAPTSAPMPTQ
jgi:hypothetical protein